jgi:hypothetical protein
MQDITPLHKPEPVQAVNQWLTNWEKSGEANMSGRHTYICGEQDGCQLHDHVRRHRAFLVHASYCRSTGGVLVGSLLS